MTREISVSLHRQVLTVFEGGKKSYSVDCLCGDKDNPTPVGHFRIERKDRKHFSAKYHRQMDYAMFFHGGVAIHMSHIVGVSSYLKAMGVDSLGSHGCVRLAESDAKKLFDETALLTPVTVVHV